MKGSLKKKCLVAIGIEAIILLIIISQSIGARRDFSFRVGDYLISDDSVQIDAENESYYIPSQDLKKDESLQILRTNHFTLKNGSYDVEIVYDTEIQNENEKIGKVSIGSYYNPAGVISNDVNIIANQTSNTNRIHVKSLTKISDVEIDVYFNGNADLRIKSINVHEIMPYRFVRIVKWILAFVLLDAGIWYFMLNGNIPGEKKKIAAGLILTIVIASIPATQKTLNKAFDLLFHIARIWSLSDEIGRGNLYPAVQTSMINGYGYVNPLLYGQIFLYIPAILYRMGLFMQEAYQCYIWLVNIATSLIAYYSFSHMVKNKNAAVVGSFLYVTAAYRIQNMYTRGALGEYTAQIFLPLVLYGFYHIYTCKTDKYKYSDWIPLVLGLTGIIQSHVLTVEMIAIFIGIFIIFSIKDTFQKQRFIVLVKTVIITFMLNASFLIPFLDSSRMDLQVMNIDNRGIQGQGENLIKALGLFYPEFCTDPTSTITEVLGLAVVGGMLIFGWCLCNREEWKISDNTELKTGLLCAIYGIIAFVISLNIFPWDSIHDVSSTLAKVVSVVQYPWRYLGIALVFLCVVSVIGLDLYSKHRGGINHLVVALVLISLIGLGYYYETMSTRHVNAYETVCGEGDIDKSYISNGEYLLEGTDLEKCKSAVVIVEDGLETSGYDHIDNRIEVQCNNISDSEKVLTIPVFNYNNYHAYIDGSDKELEIRNSDNNCIGIVVPVGFKGNISIKYERPFVWKVSYLLSGITFIGIIFCIVTGKKKGKI